MIKFSTGSSKMFRQIKSSKQIIVENLKKKFFLKITSSFKQAFTMIPKHLPKPEHTNYVCSPQLCKLKGAFVRNVILGNDFFTLHYFSAKRVYRSIVSTIK